MPDTERYRFSFWCKQRTLDQTAIPHLTTHSVQAIVGALPNPDPSERPDILLSSFAKAHPNPAEIFDIDPDREYSLACARSRDELLFHLTTLKERSQVNDKSINNVRKSQLRPEGWARIRELKRTDARDSRIAFVALRYSHEMLAYWTPHFVPAIEDAGFEPQRSAVPQHNDRIDAEIIAAIKRAKFVIADVTYANTGVYFEAGYAIGLGRPVIWTCRSDHQADMHFDTRQYNHILWDDGAHLRQQLTARIIATI